MDTPEDFGYNGDEFLLGDCAEDWMYALDGDVALEDNIPEFYDEGILADEW